MESLQHMDMKIDVYSQILQNDIFADIEKPLGRSRPDILTEIGNYKLAIEIQQSPTNIKTILQRMTEHTKNGYHTLWLIDEKIIKDHIFARNLKWINFIQTIQNGVLFVFDANKSIIPTRVDNSLLFKNNKLVVGRKILDTCSPIDINEILFEFNDTYRLNISTYDPWWINNYLDLF
jgi:competence CoiA-like predicted nuclease